MPHTAVLSFGTLVLPLVLSPFLGPPPLLFGGTHPPEANGKRVLGKTMLRSHSSAHVFNLVLYLRDGLAGFGNNEPLESKGLVLHFSCQSGVGKSKPM